MILNEYDTFRVFDWHHVLTPIVIDTLAIDAQSCMYHHALYVFGPPTSTVGGIASEKRTNK